MLNVDLSKPNPGFLALLADPTALIAVDANFYLPPDRTRIGAKYKYSFDEYKEAWIVPMHKSFPNLAIHEAVLDELVDSASSEFAQNCLQSMAPPKLQRLSDSSLSPSAEAIRKGKEDRIAPYTKYDPSRDNKDDRGEVKSLAHMGTVGYIFFASNDATALRLIEEAEQLGTTLDDLRAVHFYEGIYYLDKMNAIDRDAARKLYRYHYYITKKDKQRNPPWEEFFTGMDKLYAPIINVS